MQIRGKLSPNIQQLLEHLLSDIQGSDKSVEQVGGAVSYVVSGNNVFFNHQDIPPFYYSLRASFICSMTAYPKWVMLAIMKAFQ